MTPTPIYRTLLTVVALAVLDRPGPSLAAQSVTRYVRYAAGRDTSYGLLEGQTIRQLSGDPFHSPRPTGRTVRLADVRLLAPLDPSRVSKVLGIAIHQIQVPGAVGSRG